MLVQRQPEIVGRNMRRERASEARYEMAESATGSSGQLTWLAPSLRPSLTETHSYVHNESQASPYMDGVWARTTHSATIRFDHFSESQESGLATLTMFKFIEETRASGVSPRPRMKT